MCRTAQQETSMTCIIVVWLGSPAAIVFSLLHAYVAVCKLTIYMGHA